MVSLTTAPELMAVLAAAEQLLSVTADAVELCPRYGRGQDPSRATEPGQ